MKIEERDRKLTLGRRLRMFLCLPLFSWNWWRALSAISNKKWEKVIYYLGANHARDLDQPESYFWHGVAFSKLERWRESISEFEQIEGTLFRPREQAHRIYHHCMALHRLDRTDEAKDILRNSGWEKLPANLREYVQRLEQYFLHKDNTER